jgi:hypothetical protein
MTAYKKHASVMDLRMTRTLRPAAVVALASALLSACGGGGGGAPPITPPAVAPTVTLSANPIQVANGGNTTLTWSTTAATSCTAAQGWSGTKATSGTEQVGPLTADTTFQLTCTGTGGSTTQSVTVTLIGPPTVTLSTDPTTTVVGGTTTLTWSSTNSTGCTASGAWTGARSASGAESTDPLAASGTFTLECTGPGGTSAPVSANVTVTPPGLGNVVLSGEITFDRIPFRTLPARGLNPNQPVVSPARQVIVEAVNPNPPNAVIGTATRTDLRGRYTLEVPMNTNLRVRAHARLLKTGAPPTWDFRVRNNANGNALYVLQSSATNSGVNPPPLNLHAASGWTGAAYTAERAAAPFAIIDTVLQAKQLILTANAGTDFPALDLFWSNENRAATPFCPSDGNIGTSSYVRFGTPPNDVDECTPPQQGFDGIYILGDFAAVNGDTDEFDQHVVAHEFGHYIEDQFSRSDSIGGPHGGGDRLDLRVAFGEGWGNSYSGMTLADPSYRDSQSGVTDDFGFNMETDNQVAEGWFSELSVGELLWDIFDSGVEPGDTVALGFGPIFSVMTGSQTTTDALTSVFPFARQIRASNASSSAAISTLLTGEAISGTDDFGAGENNNGGDATVLPVYRDITLNTPLAGICSRSTSGADGSNKLGNRRFLRFVNNATRLVTISATGAAPNAQSVAATDPDIFVLQRGVFVAVGESGAPGAETIPQFSLPAGTFIIEVYDFDIEGAGPTAQPRCMTVSITG